MCVSSQCSFLWCKVAQQPTVCCRHWHDVESTSIWLIFVGTELHVWCWNMWILELLYLLADGVCSNEAVTSLIQDNQVICCSYVEQLNWSNPETHCQAGISLRFEVFKEGWRVHLCLESPHPPSIAFIRRAALPVFLQSVLQVRHGPPFVEFTLDYSSYSLTLTC